MLTSVSHVADSVDDVTARVAQLSDGAFVTEVYLGNYFHQLRFREASGITPEHVSARLRDLATELDTQAARLRATRAQQPLDLAQVVSS